MAKIIVIILFVILSLTYLILSIIFSFEYYKSSFSNNQIIEEIENSINGKPIISLNFRSYCFPGEEILFFGEWDGAKGGCNCKGSIKPNKCSIINLALGCENIPSIPSKKYHKINSKFICIIIKDITIHIENY